VILVPQGRIEEMTARGWWGERRIGDLFDAAVRAHPERLALADAPNRAEFVDGAPRRLTWREVDAEAARLAAGLLAIGVGKDDVLCVQLPNCVELVLAYVACLKLGAIITPVPVQYREHELRHVLGHSGARVFLTAERIGRHRHGDMARGMAGGFRAVTAAPQGDAGRLGDPGTGANEVFTLCWTSGTEGVPKGVPRSHNEWLSIPDTMIASAGLEPGAHLLNPFPLVNMAGIAGLLLPWLILGGRLALHHPFKLDVFLEQWRAESIEYTVAAPAILTMLAQDPKLLEGIDVGRIRAIGSGGGTVPEWTVRALAERGIAVVNYFGSNEGASLTSCALDLPNPAERAAHFPRFGAAGLEWKLPVSRRVRTRLVDPASGAEVASPGVPGELRVKGPAIFSGYWRAPELTARAFDEAGWYRTGDLFEIAGERGHLYRFVGRLKDIIVRGGFNISAEELEALLLAHPAVREAAVVGYPDDRLGERVCAVVAPRAGASVDLPALVRFLAEEKRVAAYKLPERLLLLDALPRNPVGKILKRELRERLR
jgi:acyl-CoA synthetase (AMP-forming)/AMP-acid ligase II